MAMNDIGKARRHQATVSQLGMRAHRL